MAPFKNNMYEFISVIGEIESIESFWWAEPTWNRQPAGHSSVKWERHKMYWWQREHFSEWVRPWRLYDVCFYRL